VWRIAIEDLADAAEASLAQVRRETRQQRLRLSGIAVHAIVRQRERAEQPAPDRALVIGGVALAYAAGVDADIVGMPRRQAAQSNRGQQFAAAGIHHRMCAPRIEQSG